VTLAVGLDLETDGPRVKRVGLAAAGASGSFVWDATLGTTLARCFNERAVLIVGHNLLHDLRFVDFGAARLFDTMWAAHLLEPHLKKDLGTVASLYLDLAPWKHLAWDAERYNREDARVTLALYGQLRDRLALCGMLELFERQMEALGQLVRTGWRYKIPWQDDVGGIEGRGPSPPDSVVVTYGEEARIARVLAPCEQLARDLDGEPDVHTHVGRLFGVSRACGEGLLRWALALDAGGELSRGLRADAPEWSEYRVSKERRGLQAAARQRWPGLFVWQAETAARAQAQGFVTNPFGRRIGLYKASRTAAMSWILRSTANDSMWWNLRDVPGLVGVTSEGVVMKRGGVWPAYRIPDSMIRAWCAGGSGGT